MQLKTLGESIRHKKLALRLSGGLYLHTVFLLCHWFMIDLINDDFLIYLCTFSSVFA